MAQAKLIWQSKLVQLLVLPLIGANIVLETHWWAEQDTPVAVWTVGLSVLLGLVTWRFRAAMPWAAVAGTAITASLMYSTVVVPYMPWNTALVPVLAVAVVAFIGTRLGRGKKERLGTAESRQGRSTSQVVANLGVAAVVSCGFFQSWMIGVRWIPQPASEPTLLFAVGLAALAEAAADTASSELGQVFGGRPRMITFLQPVKPGTDGAISFAGTLIGVAAAALVAVAGTLAFRGDRTMFIASCAGGTFGLLFDSLLGATFENRGWLNNDAVNFLSTASAAAVAFALLAILPQG